MIYWLCLLLFPLHIWAESIEPDFTPSWVGSLLQISPENVDPRSLQVQLYDYLNILYGQYTDSGKTNSVKTVYLFNANFHFETGLTRTFDIAVDLQGQITRSRHGTKFVYAGDTFAALGIQLMRDIKHSWEPFIRINLQQSFPTGKFDHFSPEKFTTTIAGTGSYQTTPSLVIQKTFYTIPYHPFEINLNLSYVHSTKVHVSGHSVYGGGHDADAVVAPGDGYIINLSGELAFTPRYGFALDINYNWQAQNTFTGNAGHHRDGLPDTLFTPPAYTLSIVPGFEIMMREKEGLLLGAWISLAGRNSTAFVSPALFYNVTF